MHCETIRRAWHALHEEPRFLRFLEELLAFSDKGLELREGPVTERVGFAKADAVETQDATVTEFRVG